MDEPARHRRRRSGAGDDAIDRARSVAGQVELAVGVLAQARDAHAALEQGVRAGGGFPGPGWLEVGANAEQQAAAVVAEQVPAGEAVDGRPAVDVAARDRA